MLESGIQKAVRLAGNQSALGRLLKMTPQAIQRWVAQGRPSAKGCARVESCLHGQVTKAELYPAMFGPTPFAPA